MYVFTSHLSYCCYYCYWLSTQVNHCPLNVINSNTTLMSVCLCSTGWK